MYRATALSVAATAAVAATVTVNSSVNNAVTCAPQSHTPSAISSALHPSVAHRRNDDDATFRR